MKQATIRAINTSGGGVPGRCPECNRELRNPARLGLSGMIRWKVRCVCGTLVWCENAKLVDERGYWRVPELTSDPSPPLGGNVAGGGGPGSEVKRIEKGGDMQPTNKADAQTKGREVTTVAKTKTDEAKVPAGEGFPKNPLNAAGMLDEAKKLKGDEKSWQVFTHECVVAKYAGGKKVSQALTLDELKTLKGDKGWLEFTLECIVAKYPQNKKLAAALTKVQQRGEKKEAPAQVTEPGATTEAPPVAE